MEYTRRKESSIREALSDTPVVCLLGARQTGKTTLVRHLFPDRHYVSFDDGVLLSAAKYDPGGFIASLPPVVTLDEVQKVPELLPAIKMSVDADRRPGRFLLTGSANLLLHRQASESLAGRMEVVRLHPLTEAEKENGEGRFLATLVAGGFTGEVRGSALPQVRPFAERVLAGGYPEALTRSPVRARQWHRQYVKAIIEKDVADMGTVRDAGNVGKLLELLSRRTGQLLNISSLSTDLAVSRDSVASYIGVLERLFLVRQLPAWHANEAKRLVKTPKIHMVDSGLAGALCGLEAGDWTKRRDKFGHLVESFVVQQLVAQGECTDEALQFGHYRDKDKVEVDVVVSRGAEVWGVEVKASATVDRGDIQGLLRLADKAGDGFQSGIVLYAGDALLPLGEPRIQAVPMRKLWEL